MFGFPSDPNLVLRSFTDSVAFPNSEYGLPLTNDEAAEVARRVRVQTVAQDAAVWASENDADYAGHWIDQSRGGLPVFAFAGSASDRSRQELSSRVPAGIDYEVVAVEHSWAELEGIKEAIVSRWDAIRSSGTPLVSVGFATSANAVRVGLDGRSSDVEAKLKAEFGEALTFIDARPAHSDTCPDSDCLPVKGGIRMKSAQEANVCTTGFIGKVTSASPDYYVVITAGHCFRAPNGTTTGEGDDWRHYQNGAMTKFGDAQKQTWYDNEGADVGIIKLTSVPSDRNNFVSWESNGQFAVVSTTSRVPNAGIAVGQFICRFGENSGDTCGYVVDPAEDRESEAYGLSKTIRNQGVVGFDSLPGDSGGPVDNPGNNHQAYGTHTHSTDPGDPGHPLSWFTPIGRGESAYAARHNVTYRICLSNDCSLTD